MGWSYGVTPEGREVGYGVEAKCDLDGCEADIDRGLGFLCGQMHGGWEDGRCANYYCQDHLYFGMRGQTCEECVKQEDRGSDCEHPYPDDITPKWSVDHAPVWRCDECGDVWETDREPVEGLTDGSH